MILDKLRSVRKCYDLKENQKDLEKVVLAENFGDRFYLGKVEKVAKENLDKFRVGQAMCCVGGGLFAFALGSTAWQNAINEAVNALPLFCVWGGTFLTISGHFLMEMDLETYLYRCEWKKIQKLSKKKNLQLVPTKKKNEKELEKV